MEWRRETGQRRESARHYRLVVDGSERDIQAQSTWTLGPEGSVTAFEDARGRVELAAGVSDLFAPIELGAARVFDPGALAVRDGQVSAEGARRVFTDGDVRWWVELSHGEVVAYGADALAVRRHPNPELPAQPVDPATVLGLPVQLEADPGRAHVYARWTVRGPARELLGAPTGLLVVERPLWLEVGRRSLGEGRPAAGPLGEVAARALRGADRTDQRRALRTALDGVRRELTYAPVSGSGEAALRGTQGDCTEFAAVFAEAVRQLGLDAAIQTGWVLREGSAHLVPHAWVKVDTGAPSGWVPMDPTLGQLVADPLHLPLVPELQAQPWEALGRAPGSQVVLEQAR